MKYFRFPAAMLVCMSLTACNGGSSPARLNGISLQLSDGSLISQPGIDEYNSYIVRMPDDHLVLVFGSNRSCGGCTAGNHNLFITRSVAPYNTDQRIPAFNTPEVFTVASAIRNLPATIAFAATRVGSNVRIFLNNAQGLIQYGDFLPTGGAFNVAGLTSITNSVWRKLTIAGVDEAGTGIYGRSSNGQVYWLNPAVINLILNPMSELNYTSIAQISPAQTGIPDGYFAVRNSATIVASYADTAGPVAELKNAADDARLTVQALSVTYTGSTNGDFIVLSANGSGSASQDLYVGSGLTPAQLRDAVGSKPASGAPSPATEVNGLYAWYELDGNRNDASSSGNNAFLPTTPFNGADPNYATSDRHGMTNAAAGFNGTSQYIGNNFSAKCDGNFSVSLWVRPAQVTAVRSILGFQPSPGANPGFEIVQNASAQVMIQAFFIADGFNIANTTGIGGTLVAGQWHHIAVVQDSATRLGTVYLDGIAVATSAHSGELKRDGVACTCSGPSPVFGSQEWWNGTPMTIGYAYRGFFQGDLDQVAFFNRKLTIAEIQLLASQ